MPKRRRLMQSISEWGVENADSWGLILQWLKPLVLVALLITLATTLARGLWAYKQSNWHGLEPYRILVSYEANGELMGTALVSFMPRTKEVVWVTLPPTVVIDSVGNYGKYRLDSLYKLGRLEKYQERLLVKSVEQAMGMRFNDSLVLKNNEKKMGTTNGLGEYRRILRRYVYEGFMGDGNLYNALWWWFLSRGMTETQMRVVDMTREGLNKSYDIDGAEIWSLNTVRNDQLLRRLVMSTEPEINSLTVTVLNATEKLGLATQWSRFLLMEGFDVVQVTDSTALRESGAILFDSEESMNSLGGRVIRSWFKKAMVVITPLQQYRSNVVIKLGEQAVEMIEGREGI